MGEWETSERAALCTIVLFFHSRAVAYVCVYPLSLSRLHVHSFACSYQQQQRACVVMSE